MTTRRRQRWLGLLALAMIACGQPVIDDDPMPAGFSVEGDVEPLPAVAEQIVTASDGRLAVRISGDLPIGGVEAALVDPDDGRLVGPFRPVVDGRVEWQPELAVGSHRLAIDLRPSGRRLPILVLRPSLSLERVVVVGEEDLPPGGGRSVPRPLAGTLGYDVLLSTDEETALSLVLPTHPSRVARGTLVELYYATDGRATGQVVALAPQAGGRLEVRLLVRTGPATGVADLVLVARFMEGDAAGHRAWRLRGGIHDVAVGEGSHAYEATLPGGRRRTARLTGPLPTRPIDATAAGVREALARRTGEDLVTALAGVTIDPLPDGEAQEWEATAALGSAIGFDLLDQAARADLASIGSRPVLARDYLHRARDEGYRRGPILLRQEAPAAAPLASFEYPTAAAGPPVARLTAAALPVSIPVDIGPLSDPDARIELLVLEPNGRFLSVIEPAAAGRRDFLLPRLEQGTYHGTALVTGADGQLLGVGSPFSLNVSAPPSARPSEAPEIPDDPFEFLSAQEQREMAAGGVFEKEIVVESGGRLRMETRRVVIERGQVIDTEDVRVQVVASRFDEATGQTVISFRLRSGRSKRWNLSVEATLPGQTVRAEESSVYDVAVDLEEGTPELVTFQIPGRIGESFTLLQTSLSGSPTVNIGRIGSRVVRSLRGHGLTRTLTETCDWVERLSAMAGPLEIQIGDFLAAGGVARFWGTGGPRIRLEVGALPRGMREGTCDLIVPAGTLLSGRARVQPMVLARAIRIRLGRPAFDVEATAYCNNPLLPFPGEDDELFARGLQTLRCAQVVENLQAGADGVLARYPEVVGQFVYWHHIARTHHSEAVRPPFDALREFLEEDLTEHGEMDAIEGDDREAFLDAITQFYFDAALRCTTEEQPVLPLERPPLLETR